MLCQNAYKDINLFIHYFSKLGPRRKLQMAIKELKEHITNEENEGAMSRNDVTPTPQQNLEVEMKIQLTQMKAAYQQVGFFIK